MSLAVVTPPDRAALTEELLPLFKSHVRVEFDRDDDYLELVLSRAIDLFERLTEFRVFAAVYAWTPDFMVPGGQPEPFPIIPVGAWDAFAADGTTNIKDQFKFFGVTGIDNQVTPQLIQFLAGNTWAAGNAIEITVGFATMAELPPGVIDCAFRIGAHMYENREITSLTGVDQMNPGYFNSLLGGFWQPRV